MMKRTVNQVIEDSIMEGYELLAEGTGSYDAKVEEYRKQNYDVRAWYVVRGSLEERRWVLYGKLRVRRNRKSTTKVVKASVDYNKFTVKELKSLCKEKQIAGYSRLKTKAELVNELTKADSM